MAHLDYEFAGVEEDFGFVDTGDPCPAPGERRHSFRRAALEISLLAVAAWVAFVAILVGLWTVFEAIAAMLWPNA